MNEELIDIWYALGGAETRYPGGFGELVDAALRELHNQFGDNLPSFLEPRFRPYRFIDSKEDAAANGNAGNGC